MIARLHRKDDKMARINHASRRRGGGIATRLPPWVTYMSLALNAFLLLVCLVVVVVNGPIGGGILRGGGGKVWGKEVVWHGGHPQAARTGSCWCSLDMYCMCNPSLAIDLVIVTEDNAVWLVRRKDTNQLATMGGFVEVGETVEEAVRRELWEEMRVRLEFQGDKMEQLRLLGVYSDPRRDNRRHTASAVFAVRIDSHHHPPPRAADDAKAVVKIPLDQIEQHNYFADHKTILLDYKRSIQPQEEQDDGGTPNNNNNKEANHPNFAQDIARSTCFS